MITAQDAVDQLFRVAVTENKATSTARLDTLAEFCVQELTRRGLHGAAKEASIPGAGRRKRWDVAWQYDGKYRLGLSLKSILKNLGGTVPNRIDDLIGEVANAQLLSPEIVIGYVMIFNVHNDAYSSRHQSTWLELHRHSPCRRARRSACPRYAGTRSRTVASSCRWRISPYMPHTSTGAGRSPRRSWNTFCSQVRISRQSITTKCPASAPHRST